MARQKVKTIAERVKEKKEEQDLKKKYKIEADKKIVIEKKGFFVNLLFFIQTSIIKIMKAGFFILIAIFSSIGFTILINQPLRELFLEMLVINFS